MAAARLSRPEGWGVTPGGVLAPAPVPVWVPNPGPQTLLVACPVWDVLYGGARGGGKTDGLLGDFTGFSLGIERAAAAWARVRAITDSRERDRARRELARFVPELQPKAHARGLFIRRTYDELDEAVARAHEILGPLGATWKAAKYSWILPWGGFLKMRYLQRDSDASRYQGHSYNWLGVDEAGNFPKSEPIKKLTATLRDRYGVAVRKRMSANPGGPGHAWLKADYVDAAPPMVPHADPDTGLLRVYIPSKLSDNPALVANDPLYEVRLRGSGPAWLVQAWLNGDWNAAPEGGIIKLLWLASSRYRQVPDAPEAIMRVHSWDTAYKAAEHNDPSCLTDWTVAKASAAGKPGFYLRNVFKERLTYPALRQRVIEFAERDSPDAILIEDKASGQSLLQDLRDSTALPVIAIEPEGDKVTRALRVTPLMESGRTHLPERATWLLDYELELTLFPTKGVNDDQVDSTTQALSWMATHGGVGEVTGSGIKRAAGTEGFAGRTYSAGVGFGSVPGAADSSGFT